MKTERRQELRTDVLSEQIGQVGDFAKKNAAILSIVGVIVIAIAVGIYWYINHQATLVSDGWAVLGQRDEGDTPAILIDRFKALAQQKIDPALTATAWLSIGEVALREKLFKPAAEDGSPPSTMTDEQLAQTAKEAYQSALATSPNNTIVTGPAHIGLGVVAENAGQFDEARRHYQQVIEDPAYDNTPFKAEARFRLTGLEAWSEAIEFVLPPPSVLLPPEDAAATTTSAAASTQAAAEAPSTQPAAGVKVGETPAVPSPAPIPTTQPAGE